MKGQTLLIVVLILSSVTLVGLNWGLVSIVRMRGAIGLSDSIKALYAADAGIECEIYKSFKDNTFDCVLVNPMTNNTRYEIDTSVPGRIISVGIAIPSDIRRSLQIEY